MEVVWFVLGRSQLECDVELLTAVCGVALQFLELEKSRRPFVTISVHDQKVKLLGLAETKTLF